MKKSLLLTFFALVFSLVFFLSTPSEAAVIANGIGEHDERTLIEAARAMRASGMVQFNFTDLELVAFVRFVSEIMQRPIIIPPNATGRITVISPRPSTIQEARQIFISVLLAHGWGLQNMGEYDRLVQGVGTPSPDHRNPPRHGEEVITYIATLRYIVADFVAHSMQQAFGHTVIVLPVGNGRDILLQGRATDVTRAREIIRSLDVQRSANVSSVLTLSYADPGLVANQLNAIAHMGTHLRGLSATGDPNSRQVVLVGESRVIAEAERIIAQLDVDFQESEFHIHRLRHIDATAASEQISRVLAASAQMTRDGHFIPASVVPDLTTNSLIFTATQRQFDSIQRILEEIDIQPRQVLIRGFIAEINVTNLDRAGIDWAILGGQIWDNFMLGATGQLGEMGVPAQFAQWFSELSRREERVTDATGTYTITNYRPLALLYATVEMLRRYDAINVLSVPRLMATDGRESSFQVGQVIPVMTGMASDLTNPSALQQSINYRDTGLTLTVTPHIRSGNLIALDIEQSTEDVLTAMGATMPVTAKRHVRTSVIVEDGETIIIGGMVKETERHLRRRVPGLSYIPLIGRLFQRVSREREKLDFVIFLTPHIVDNTQQRREVINQVAATIGDPEMRLAEMSPVERAIRARFDALYQQSVRNNRF